MSIKVSVLAHPEFSRQRQLQAALTTLNATQSKIYFDLSMSDAVPNVRDFPVIDPNATRSAIINQFPAHENVAIVTDSQFSNNWFSMTSNSGTIISTNSWEEEFSPPALKTYLQMELILHVVACAADLTDNLMERMSHGESIGCLFDFCAWKPDVRFKIIGGHLCDSCSGKLRAHGIDLELQEIISSLLETMRLDSIGRAAKIAADNVFAAMRFSKNDANDHSFLYGVKPAFEAMGFHVERADGVADSGILIEKIFRMIDEAWAVVVLSGEINLNVFFEYGYAVGRRKPIFLVTPSHRLIDTPTDIKGFEHIVYSEGDFEGLKTLLVNRLKALPRFSKST